MPDINELVSLISETQKYFQQQAQRQVNTALTLRNWLFGFYIAEYELNGADRAEYGAQTLKEISIRAKDISGLSERNLYLFKTFYLAYPQILQSVTAKLHLSEFQHFNILQSVTAKLIPAQSTAGTIWQTTDIKQVHNLPKEDDLRRITEEEQQK